MTNDDTRHKVFLRRLNPDGETLGAVDALEVDDRTFRQFMIDLAVESGLGSTPHAVAGTVAAVVVGDPWPSGDRDRAPADTSTSGRNFTTEPSSSGSSGAPPAPSGEPPATS